MNSSQNKSGFHSQFSRSWVSNIASAVSWSVRRKMFAYFIKEFPMPLSVLDVGVTSESIAPEANYFEELFPKREIIVACGIEDASNIEINYPGVKFVKIRENGPLPFADGEFDVVFCSAVLEHITEEAARIAFLRELLRVGRNLFLTVPCRWFPIEHHTALPFFHMLRADLFFYILKKLKRDQFYNSHNLSFLSFSDLAFLMPKVAGNFKILTVRYFGFSSNYLIIVKNSQEAQKV